MDNFKNAGKIKNVSRETIWSQFIITSSGFINGITCLWKNLWSIKKLSTMFHVKHWKIKIWMKDNNIKAIYENIKLKVSFSIIYFIANSLNKFFKIN